MLLDAYDEFALLTFGAEEGFSDSVESLILFDNDIVEVGYLLLQRDNSLLQPGGISRLEEWRFSRVKGQMVQHY